MDFSLLEAKLIWATVRAVEPASRHCAMYPEDIPVWWLQRGNVQLRYEGGVTVAKAGHWIFPPRGSVWHDFSEDAVVLSVRFRLRWPNGRELFERNRPLVLAHSPRGIMGQVANELVKCATTKDSPLKDGSPTRYFEGQAALYRWLGIYLKILPSLGMPFATAAEMDHRLVRAKVLLDGAPLAQRLSRTAFASQAGLSVPQLTRLFKTQHGVTPRAYFEQRRLTQACSELARGGSTIKTIASELGFNGLSEFSNWFSRHVGKSPRSYRIQAHL